MEKNVCKGQCLWGKCPFEGCIRYKAGRGKNDIVPEIRTMTELPPIHANLHFRGQGIAIDIGTTTVAVYLWEGNRLMGCISEANKQVTMGMDVLSRIRFCDAHSDGLALLHGAIISQLDEMISRLLKQNSSEAANVCACVITGNTVMLHLLSGLSPVSMGQLPFAPISKFGYKEKAATLGIKSLACDIYFPPCLSAYVGADITTAMLATGFGAQGKTLLLMDIGTNGELAIMHNGRIYAASAAAGPAFEGAELSCGMAGVDGAVCHVYPQDGTLEIDVIGEGVPRGMCGSGVVDFLAVMLDIGAIDETGTIVQQSPFCVTKKGSPALLLTDGIYLTQKDIRMLQAAKAAIAGGVHTLAHEAGIGLKEIDATYIAGGFGNYMDTVNARRIGLIPDEIRGVQSIGNAAAAGALLLLTGERTSGEADSLLKSVRLVELGGNPFFNRMYVECMHF